jgi:hypothetical protein
MQAWSLTDMSNRSTMQFIAQPLHIPCSTGSEESKQNRSPKAPSDNAKQALAIIKRRILQLITH